MKNEGAEFSGGGWFVLFSVRGVLLDDFVDFHEFLTFQFFLFFDFIYDFGQFFFVFPVGFRFSQNLECSAEEFLVGYHSLHPQHLYDVLRIKI